jgi:hypothetical protein
MTIFLEIREFFSKIYWPLASLFRKTLAPFLEQLTTFREYPGLVGLSWTKLNSFLQYTDFFYEVK